MDWGPLWVSVLLCLPWHVEDCLLQEWGTGLETAEHATSLKGASTVSNGYLLQQDFGPGRRPGLSRRTSRGGDIGRSCRN